MFTATDICMFGIGILLLITYLIFFVKGLKYKEYFENLDDEEYPLNELYIVGLAVLQAIHYDYTSKSDRILRQQIDILYGKKYEDFYLMLIRSQQISIAFTLVTLGFCLYGLIADAVVVILIAGLSGIIFYYFGTSVADKMKERADSMLSDFSEVVSKLALLTNAGLILKEAWEVVAYNGERELYKEMQLSVIEMQNGSSEVEAISQFAARSMLPEIRKFCSSITQGLEKGNRELVYTLQSQSKECWELKQQLVRRQGEKMSSKLMIPMMLMFVGILIMIIVPIFINMGF